MSIQMKEKMLKYGWISCIILAIATEYFSNIKTSYLVTIIFAMMSVACLLMLLHTTKQKKLQTFAINYSLIAYMWLLLNFTLFGGSFGRLNSLAHWSVDNFNTHLEHSVNLTPFDTIKLYWNMGFNTQMIVNLLGNMLAFSPLGILLPLVNYKFNKFHIYTSAVLIMILCVEISQIVFMVGAFDVDDIILNYVGAIVVLYICRFTGITNLISRLYTIQQKYW